MSVVISGGVTIRKVKSMRSSVSLLKGFFIVVFFRLGI